MQEHQRLRLANGSWFGAEVCLLEQNEVIILFSIQNVDCLSSILSGVMNRKQCGCSVQHGNVYITRTRHSSCQRPESSHSGLTKAVHLVLYANVRIWFLALSEICAAHLTYVYNVTHFYELVLARPICYTLRTKLAQLLLIDCLEITQYLRNRTDLISRTMAKFIELLHVNIADSQQKRILWAALKQPEFCIRKTETYRIIYKMLSWNNLDSYCCSNLLLYFSISSSFCSLFYFSMPFFSPLLFFSNECNDSDSQFQMQTSGLTRISKISENKYSICNTYCIKGMQALVERKSFSQSR